MLIHFVSPMYLLASISVFYFELNIFLELNINYAVNITIWLCSPYNLILESSSFGCLSKDINTLHALSEMICLLVLVSACTFLQTQDLESFMS